MKKNKKLFFGVIVFVVVCITLNTFFFVRNLSQKLGDQGLGIPATLTERYSKLGNFTIMVPETWSALDTPQGNGGNEDVIFSISNFNRSIYAQVSRYTTADSLDSFSQSEIEKIESEYSDYRPIGLDEYSFAESLGTSHEYFVNKGYPILGKSEFHCLDWYTIYKSGYNFSFCVVSQNWGPTQSILFEMINSIKFK